MGTLGRDPQSRGWQMQVYSSPYEIPPFFTSAAPCLCYPARMLFAAFPAAVALVGLLVYAFATNGNAKTIGLACFTAGLAACLVLFHGPTLRLP